MARLRLTFGRGEPVKYLAHLDLFRLWERVFRRAEIPVAYSAGFTPHPKIAIAAPLPVGVTSECELMDVTLTEARDPADFAARVRPQLPGGICLHNLAILPDRGRALPALVEAITYRVTLQTAEDPARLPDRIARLLATASVPFHRDRGGKVRDRDLRPFILDLQPAGTDDRGPVIEMRLRVANEGAGRPEEVAAALGFPDRPHRIHRIRIDLAPEA